MYIVICIKRLLQFTDNPEVTVGGHAPVNPQLSGQRSASPVEGVRKRNSTVPLLEPTEERPGQGGGFTGNLRSV